LANFHFSALTATRLRICPNWEQIFSARIYTEFGKYLEIFAQNPFVGSLLPKVANPRFGSIFVLNFHSILEITARSLPIRSSNAPASTKLLQKFMSNSSKGRENDIRLPVLPQIGKKIDEICSKIHFSR